jgi:hypothetical protein
LKPEVVALAGVKNYARGIKPFGRRAGTSPWNGLKRIIRKGTINR